MDAYTKADADATFDTILSVDAKLGNYPTKEQVTATLADYAKTEDLDAKFIDDRARITNLEKRFNYHTKTSGCAGHRQRTS